MNHSHTLETLAASLLQVSQFQPVSLVTPNSWCGHLPFAAWLVQQFKPEIFVELGTHTGNSFFTFCQAVKENSLPTRCYAIDTWQGDEHAGYYGDEIYGRVDAHTSEHYNGFARLLRTTFDEGLNYFADNSIDLLHIDGLHTYDAVKHDFDTWLPKLGPGAVVIFHDTNVRQNNFGVWQLWQELAQRYPAFEFLHSHGLGLLQLDGGAPEKRLAWLSAPEELKHTLRDYFAALGNQQVTRLANMELTRQNSDLQQRLTDLYKQLENMHNDMLHAVSERARVEQLLFAERDQAEELQRVLASRTSELEQAAAQQQLLIERQQELEQAIQQIISSTSWRITAPVRALSGAVRGASNKPDHS